MIYYILIILLLVAIFFIVYLLRRIFEYQDLIDDFLDDIIVEEKDIKDALDFITNLANTPLLTDSPEVKRLVANVKKTKIAIESLKKMLDETKKNININKENE